MASGAKRRFLFFILLVFLVLTLACQQKQPSVVIVALKPLVTPQLSQGIVTFISGDALAFQNGAWSMLSIGDFVEENARIKVEKGSFCEIQFGDLAIIRIEENSVVSVATLLLEKGNSQVKMDLEVGAILNKVEKLSGNDSYSVFTSTAVCGVRGTEFLVESHDGDKTKIAVKEGSVKVLPPEVKTGELEEKVAKSDNKDKEQVVGIIRKIDEQATLVAANQELEISKASFKETTASYQALEAKVTKISAQASTTAEDLARLEQTVQTTIDKNASVGDGKKDLSAASKTALDKTGEMKKITVSAAGSAQSYVKIAVQVEPKDALILINGQTMGSGSYSGLFASAQVLKIELRKEGYAGQEFEVTVSPGEDRLFQVKLLAVAGSLSSENPVPQETQPVVGAEAAPKAAVDTAPVKSETLVKKEDKSAATKEAVVSAKPAETVKKAEKVIPAETAKKAEKVIPAEVAAKEEAPKPIEIKFKVSPVPLVGNIAYTTGKILTSNSQGMVYAYSSKGLKLWSAPTKNIPNELSFPVISGSRVYFSGSTEMVVYDLNSGARLYRMDLGADYSHAFGRRVVISAGMIMIPGNTGIKLLDATSFALKKELAVDDVRITPAIYENKIIVVDQKGLLMALNMETGAAEWTVNTQAVLALSQKVQIVGSRAYFSGRKGPVVCVDLAAQKVVWEKDLKSPTGKAISVFNDLEIGSDGLYVYSNGELFALSLKTGAPLFAAVTGVTVPPVIGKEGLVYTTSDGKLIIANPQSGSVIKSLEMGEKSTTRPVFADGKIIAGTEQGNIFILNPAVF